MPYPGERPHAFIQVDPGVKHPEFCRRCGDLRTHSVHSVEPPKDHEYEPGEVTHRMHSDPDCKACGGPKH